VVAWLGIALLLLVVSVCTFILPPYFASRDSSLQHIDRSKLENDVRTTLLQGVAGMLVVVGGIAAWLQLDTNRKQLRQALDASNRELALAREGQITERFTKAIEQLAGNTLDLKVGGIYALERIAHDSDLDRHAIREILAAYVRGHSPWPPDNKAGLPPDHPISDLPPLRTRSDDIQMAMTALGRKSLFGDELHHGDAMAPKSLRDSKRADSTFPERIILSQVDLRGAYLRDAALPRVDFTNAHLERADLIGADLQSSRLGGADFRQALLTNANLGRAYLVNGHLQGAHFESALLERVKLMGANLEGAHLINANLTGANLRNAVLRGASMTKCILTNCDLRGVRGLEEVYGLEPEQLREAITDTTEKGRTDDR
jgi:uncharacterized protein YjbI with pentapeptide repeats